MLPTQVLRSLLKPLPKRPVLGRHVKPIFTTVPGPSELASRSDSYWINPGLSALPEGIAGSGSDMAIAVRLHNGRPIDKSDPNTAFSWESEVWFGKLSGGINGTSFERMNNQICLLFLLVTVRRQEVSFLVVDRDRNCSI